MRVRLTAAALAALLTANGAARAESPISGYAWTARPLLVFAPSAKDARLLDQAERFRAEAAELDDRAMPLILVAGEDVVIDRARTVLSADALRRHYGVAVDAFAVLLIGKDQGVKLRSDVPVAPDRVFALVDRMPMRQEEMRRRKASE